MSGPAKNLKCVDYKWRSHENDVVQVYFFDDGSVWNKWQGEWNVEWQPEPTAAAPAATPERPKTITADELRVGDKMHLFGELRRIKWIGPTGRYSISGVKTVSMKCELVEFLARGVQVYRDGKLISGWPIESPPWGADAGRIAELESEVKAWKQAANTGSQTSLIGPSDLVCRISEYEERIAALKAQPQEVPPLIKGKVFATAVSIAARLAKSEDETESRFWSVVRETAERAKYQINGHGMSSYEIE